MEDLEFKSSLSYIMRKRQKGGEGKKGESWERGRGGRPDHR